MRSTPKNGLYITDDFFTHFRFRLSLQKRRHDGGGGEELPPPPPELMEKTVARESHSQPIYRESQVSFRRLRYDILFNDSYLGVLATKNFRSRFVSDLVIKAYTLPALVSHIFVFKE